MEHGNEHLLFQIPLINPQSPSKNTQPRRPVATHSPIAPSSSPSSSSSTHPFITSSTPSATSASSSATPTSQHPLAQPPITATTSSATPSPAPLPFVSLVPPHITSLKSALVRRRSSFPPATTPGSGSASNIFPWVMGGTPGANGFDWGSALDSFPGFNVELGEATTAPAGLTPGTLAWDTLLNFDTDIKPSASKLVAATAESAKPVSHTSSNTPTSQTIPRAKSDPLSDNVAHPPQPIPFTHHNQTTAPTPSSLPQPAVSPARVIQLGTDLAWRTALASVVEVEGVGQVTVARILQEVWRRGGGEIVTSQCLWPSIVIALSMPSEPGPGVRIQNPSAQSAMALQQLYNLSIRHWEPTIFTGLLGAYGSSSPSPAPISGNHETSDAFAPTPHYGPSTPLKEPDVSQWMNLTPSGWNTDALFGGGNDNNTAARNVSGGFPFPMNADLGSEALAARRASLAKTENGDDANIKSIDEILASMEEGKEENERAMMAANLTSDPQISVPFMLPMESGHPTNEAGPSRQNSTYQFPTPETDSSNSPSSGKMSNKPTTTLSPVSMASPHVTAGSITSTLVGPSPTATIQQPHPPTGGKPHPLKQRPTQLSMPAVDFIPPPPMCMFFNPSFENLTDGKAGIWRGDLEVRGRGGGKFPILVIGEKDTEHLWQSHLWPSTLAYPLNQHPVESCTSTMIPVSHLAREGLVPITMGMVLCNEPPERLAPYVNMVHGLHAEGVGFHLPCETRLPIVFLPAKFHSSDPLLRLGIAFMGKTGFSHPNAPLPSTRGRGIKNAAENDEQPKKKRRRQSAPAAAGESLRGRKKKDNGIIVMGHGSMINTTVGKIAEEE
ncbi:hypothetical protein I302_106020 [Kwoniella bestiolae CBS 10118]|uniref:ARID domain-containing protein n=1 Tax=Kwoniella bestiolae CBS 10118 TaxID=1296100 RepID=A0A1B9G2U6_9TREE|nr:hypothetical protein I302_05144 [Kwoniella bestiolae CBS 10118]OCF25328.1 hypothetical protein I302_05144 [Kwoniella bestiolae CBS 10118]